VNALTGTTPLSVNLTPDDGGRMRLLMTSSDAGSVLNALDIYETMIGGNLRVEGLQIPGQGLNDIEGSFTIKEFKVVKAPVLAQLINAFSLSGLGQLLGNEGIVFDNLRAKFIWRESNNARFINLYDGRTSGASIRLTFGGIINQTENNIDISGTFVPVAEINKFVSKIPILGELLTGGKDGGIIAATYAIKGPSEKPSVTINPLSVLAPGFLRSILFEGGMDRGRDEEPSEPQGQVPKTRNLN
jgi:hypothetical protein